MVKDDLAASRLLLALATSVALLGELVLSEQLTVSAPRFFSDRECWGITGFVHAKQSTSPLHTRLAQLRRWQHGQCTLRRDFAAELIPKSQPKRCNGKLTVLSRNRSDARG